MLSLEIPYPATRVMSHHVLFPNASAEVWSINSLILDEQGPVWGKLYDNYGPRYLLLVGSFLHVFGLMMASLWYVDYSP